MSGRKKDDKFALAIATVGVFSFLGWLGCWLVAAFVAIWYDSDLGGKIWLTGLVLFLLMCFALVMDYAHEEAEKRKKE